MGGLHVLDRDDDANCRWMDCLMDNMVRLFGLTNGSSILGSMMEEPVFVCTTIVTGDNGAGAADDGLLFSSSSSSPSSSSLMVDASVPPPRIFCDKNANNDVLRSGILVAVTVVVVSPAFRDILWCSG